MLTKKSNNNKWKLIISIPLLAMSVLAMNPISDGILNNMDKSSGVTKNANTTIEWDILYSNDTIEVYDPENDTIVMMVSKNNNGYIAKSINGNAISNKISEEITYLSDILGEKTISDLKKQLPNTESIGLANVVIDNYGKIQYYDIYFKMKANAPTPNNLENEKIVATKKLIAQKIEKNQKVNILDDDKGKIIFYLSYSNIILR